VVFDDLVANPLAVYRNALDFLHVDYDGQTSFESRYASRMYRYRWLQRILFVPATQGGRMMATLQQRARKYNPDGSKRPTLVKRLTQWNKVAASPEPLSEATKNVVRETLRPDFGAGGRCCGRQPEGCAAAIAVRNSSFINSLAAMRPLSSIGEDFSGSKKLYRGVSAHPNTSRL